MQTLIAPFQWMRRLSPVRFNGRPTVPKLRSNAAMASFPNSARCLGGRRTWPEVMKGFRVPTVIDFREIYSRPFEPAGHFLLLSKPIYSGPVSYLKWEMTLAKSMMPLNM